MIGARGALGSLLLSASLVLPLPLPGAAAQSPVSGGSLVIQVPADPKTRP